MYRDPLLRITYPSPVSYTHLDVYQRQVIVRIKIDLIIKHALQPLPLQIQILLDPHKLLTHIDGLMLLIKGIAQGIGKLFQQG